MLAIENHAAITLFTCSTGNLDFLDGLDLGKSRMQPSF